MTKSRFCRACGREILPAPQKSAKCPHCGFDPPAFARQVLAGFAGEIGPSRVTPLYRLGIVLVTIVMVLLPLIYVGLIAAVIWLTFMHATVWGPEMLSDNSRHGGRQQISMFLVAYVGPLVASVVLIVFMLKPLLAARPKRQEAHTLDPQDEPLLCEFVARLCDRVGAPRPRQIQVDCLVNASAGLRNGWLSLFSNDLVLTIGAPLITGLSLRQFTGVLAHEFGHFSQGTGMRLTYIIRSVNAWFARVVYERDAWDEGLTNLAKLMPIRELQAIFWFSQLMVWVTRKILWILMYVGHGISCFMLREMEFDADRCEARIEGSESFAATTEQLQVLNIAWHGALSDCRQLMSDGQLVDDVCELLRFNITQIPSDTIEKIRDARSKQKTGWFDTHPCDLERVARAGEEKAAGIFHVDGQAAQLFTDFPRLAREVSVEFYKESLGSDFRPAALVPTAQFLARQSAQQLEATACGQLFCGVCNELRPLAFASVVEPASTRDAVKDLLKTRQEVQAAAPEYQQCYSEYVTADKAWLLAERAVALIEAGLHVKPADFQIERSDELSATAACDHALHRQATLVPRLGEYETLVERRFDLACYLLKHAAGGLQLPDAAAWQAEITQLRELMAQLSQLWLKVLWLRNASAALTILLHNLQGREENQKLRKSILAKAKRTRALIIELLQGLQDVPYPFEHATQGISVAGYALEKVPAADDLGAIYVGSQAMQSQLSLLLVRVVGRLAYLALATEQAVEQALARKRASAYQ